MRARLVDFANIGPKMPFPAEKATRLLVVTAIAVASVALAPIATASSATAQTDRSGETPRRDTVREQNLSPPAGQALGVLDPDRGGLGLDMWRGSSAATVAALLGRLPAATRSRVLHGLARRLLLTAATPPAGGTATDGKSAADLLTLRFERLYAMAALDGLAALSHVTAKRPGAAARIRPVIDGLLLEGRTEPACTAVEAHLGAAVTPFLERAAVVCHARAGRNERAAMALALLRDTGHKVDPAFAALVDAAAGRAPAPARLAQPTALQVALLSAGRFALPELPLDRMAPPLLRGVVLSGKPPRARRIAAAERLAADHALPDGVLAALYAGADVPAAKVAGARDIRLRDYGREARIRLYQAAALETDPAQRMLTLAAWWRLAVAAGDEPLTARLTAPLLKNIKPGRRWQDYAAHIARVYFWTGRLRRGVDWYGVLKAAPFRNPDDFYRLTAMASLAAVPDEEDLRGWRDYQRRWGSARAAARAARFYALLDGLGEAPAALADWRDRAVAPQPAGPAVDDWRAVEAAAADGRRGETVLRILVALGRTGLAKASPAALTTAVRALRRVGLARDARALAVEAALRAGL
jgi:hypothetical protein